MNVPIQSTRPNPLFVASAIQFSEFSRTVIKIGRKFVLQAGKRHRRTVSDVTRPNEFVWRHVTARLAGVTQRVIELGRATNPVKKTVTALKTSRPAILRSGCIKLKQGNSGTTLHCHIDTTSIFTKRCTFARLHRHSFQYFENYPLWDLLAGTNTKTNGCHSAEELVTCTSPIRGKGIPLKPNNDK